MEEKMNYEKTTWQNGDIITAEKLNNIEDGIANGCPKFIQIRERFPSLSQEPTKEDMEFFRQNFICDPKSINPTKKVYGLYKIFSKNLKCSDFIGTIFEHIVEQRAATIIHTTAITEAKSIIIIDTSGLSDASYIKLITADDDELYYFPTTGYFGEAPLLGRMILDLGYINLDNSGTQVPLDIRPQISISELHNLSDNDWIPYAIKNGKYVIDQWPEGEIEFLDDHSARINFDDLGGGAESMSISLFDDGQPTISGVNSAIGATGIISDFAIIMWPSQS